MNITPKPDLTEYEDEEIPFDEVMRRLVDAKPAPESEKQPEKPTNANG